MNTDYDFFLANKGKIMTFKTSFPTSKFIELEKRGALWKEIDNHIQFDCCKIKIVGFAAASHCEFILFQYPENEDIGEPLDILIADCELYETDQTYTILHPNSNGVRKYGRSFSAKIFPYIRQSKIKDSFPHKCPSCNSKAYIGFKEIDCSNISCKHH